MQNEIWKAVGAYPHYEVSNLGRVKAIERLRANGRLCKETILRPRVVGAGYLQVVLYRDLNRHCKYVHVLVAQAFCENPNGLPEVNHKNLIKHDCRADNLEWSTRISNIRHARQSGSFDMADKLMFGNRHQKGISRKGKTQSRKSLREKAIIAIRS